MKVVQIASLGPQGPTGPQGNKGDPGELSAALDLTITGSLFVSGTSGNITASGNISASGVLFTSLSLDSSTYNTVMYNTSSGKFFFTGSYGGGGGGGGGFLSKLGISDIRLKDNISLLKEGKEGDPNIYSFSYIWDSNTIWSGVMAQELLNTKHADAVETHPEGYYMVDYGKLGVEMKQLSAKEQHGV